MKPYSLNRKNETLGIIDLLDDGSIHKFMMLPEKEALCPLHNENSTDWIKKWWKRRAVPISQGHIKTMLEKKGLVGPEDYLAKNLGLSLTDYYWIKPLDIQLTWEDVNLFTNDFHDDINIAGEEADTPNAITAYTPNSSLQGTLEKCWTIKNGKRGMIKGNRSSLSAESLNEVIASKLHEMQGFQNYTPYKLMEIHGKDYAYGCFSELFTSQDLELVSAYDVVESEKKRQDINYYEHFIQVSNRRGLKEEVLRPFLEYQIMTDFIISGRDRHLSNISILRDANTLEFVSPAPIYDSGKSLFVYESVPQSEREMLRIKTESFKPNELGLLDLVKDKTWVDISKLPSKELIKEIYMCDPNVSEKRVDDIVAGYEMKIDLFDRWQHGKDLKSIAIGRCSKTARNSSVNIKDIFIE